MANRVLENNRYLVKEKALLREVGNGVLGRDQICFNCGGFALGTYDWYLPYADEDQWEEWWYDEVKEQTEDYNEWCDLMADRYIRFMERDRVCREIRTEDELRPGEYLVLFRASPGDFHYARRLSNGEWWHKMGYKDIEQISEDKACGDRWWRNLEEEYGGRTRLLAVKQVDFAAVRQERRRVGNRVA